MKKIIILIWFVSSIFSYSQKVTYQSNPNLDFNDFLRGVKYAMIVLDEEQQKSVDEINYRQPDFHYSFAKYLSDIGFEYVFLTSKEKKDNRLLESICDIAYVDVFGDLSLDDEISGIAIRFVSCLEDIFVLESPRTIEYDNDDEALSNSIEEWHSLLNHKPPFAETYQLKLPIEMTQWTESTIKNYLDVSQIDEIEGIYEKVKTPDDGLIQNKYKLGIIKNATKGYDIIYLGGASNIKDWQEGEKKGEINFTAKQNFYTTKWLMQDKFENTDAYCSIVENGFLKFIFSKNEMVEENSEDFFLKLYPIGNNISSGGKKGTATAFAITQDGYLVTSQHVVEGSTGLKVMMNNETGQTSYDVSIVLEDKNNDLAVLKINDPKFQNLNPIPFIIKTSLAKVGEDVYVLGYPLSTTMGNELKVTDGIISSKTGFQGDLTSYQVSAPVQPGNSGGPLFDKKGNLIGIISAKHIGAENVSYAVKSSYLINVINALEKPPGLPTKNLLSGKSLPDQIKLLKDYIFMLEVY